jgi:4-amino-4-deoxy-L-arabinose transferase-like glycosyltransferase
MPRRRFLIWLGLILLLAFALRFYRLGEIPVALYWDEAAMLVDARSVAATGQDMHGNSWLQAVFVSYGDYKLPVYIWLASLSVKFFGAGNWALRLPSALAGLGTVLVSGAIVWQLFDQLKAKQRRLLALLTALVAAITPWSILFSKAGFEGHVGQFLLAASIWWALKMKTNRWWGLISALVGSLATYTYFSIRFVWPVVFITTTLLFLPWLKKNWLKQTAVGLVVPLIIYAVSLLPMFNSPFYAPSQQFRLSTVSVLNMTDWPVASNDYKLQAGNNLIDKLTYHPWVLKTRALAKNYADNLSFDFLFVSGDTNLRHSTGRHGLFLWVMVIPFSYGWYTVFKKHWRQGLLLLIWWLIALLPASVPEETPHALRSLNALVPLVVVIGWGSYQLWQLKLGYRWKNLALMATAMILSLSLVDFTSFYFKTYPALSADDWQDGYQQLAKEAWQNRDQFNNVWIDEFDGRFYLWVMAYQMDVDDYQRLTYENYQPSRIDNLHFSWFDWDKLPNLSGRVKIIGEKPLLDGRLETAVYLPEDYQIFYTSDGRAAYVSVIMEQPK